MGVSGSEVGVSGCVSGCVSGGLGSRCVSGSGFESVGVVLIFFLFPD